MKRLLLTSIVALVCAVGFAQKVTIDKITYKIEKGEAYVLDADKDIEVANIQSSVEYKGKSYPVTRISQFKGSYTKYDTPSKNYGFAWCKKLNSVIIPNTVKIIDSYAFALCTNLHSITIPNSVTDINHHAFDGCKFTEISIPNSVKFIGKDAFRSVPLEKLIVPDLPMELGTTLTDIHGITWEGSVLSGCNKVTDVRCQNGSFPLWVLPYLSEKCPFVLAHKYQQGGNNNMYAQNVQQSPVQNDHSSQPEKKPSSDVDVNLPSNAQSNTKTFAVIFANESVSREQIGRL